jgi:hypothetical protein
VQRLVQIASGEAEAEPQAEQAQPEASEEQPKDAGDEPESGDPDTK